MNAHRDGQAGFPLLGLNAASVSVLVLLAVILPVALIAGLWRSGFLGRWRSWLMAPARVVNPRTGTSVESTTSRLRRYWYLPAASLCSIAAVISFVIAVMEIADISFNEFRPWLFAGLAILFSVLALIAFSYAPPGPNWIEKIAGLDSSIVLFLIGAAIAGFGTLGVFDFNEIGTAPSNWWLALIAGGAIIAMAGIVREEPPVEPKEPPESEPAEGI